jgi:LysM repeat protein
MKRKYILKNKRRFSVFIIFLVLLIVSTGYIVNAGTVQTKTSYDVVRIEKGDTLWEIASLYAENSDPRAYIYEIKKLNKLDGDLIFEGQELYLP